MDTKKTWEEFAATWKAVMGRPEEFFATWDPAEGWQKVIVFNVICGLIGGILTTVLTFFFGIGASERRIVLPPMGSGSPEAPVASVPGSEYGIVPSSLYVSLTAFF